MTLVLTAYGTAEGFGVSTFASGGGFSWSPGFMQSNHYITPRSDDVNDGFFIGRSFKVDSNADGQTPSSSGITGIGSSTMVAGDRETSYTYVGGAIVILYDSAFFYTIDNAALAGTLLPVYAPGDPAFLRSMTGGWIPYGVANRERKLGYIPLQTSAVSSFTNPGCLIVQIDSATGDITQYLDYGATGGRTLRSMAFFDSDHFLILWGTVSGDTQVEKVAIDTASVMESWAFPVFDLALFPYADIRGIGVQRGSREGKWLISCAKRPTLTTETLCILEFDSTIPVTAASFSEVALAEVSSTSDWEICAIAAFGESFGLIIDRAFPGGVPSFALVTRISLPPDTTLDNDEPDSTPPTPPTPDNGDGWTRSCVPDNGTWQQDCRPEASTTTVQALPPTGGWLRTCGPV